MIISFASAKGGVGKSSVCGAMACELAKRGRNVLVFDLDPNKTLGKWGTRAPYPGVTVRTENEKTFSDAFAEARGGGYDHILIDMAGVLHSDMLGAIAWSNLVIIPTGNSLPDLEEAVQMAGRVKRLGRDVAFREIPFRVLLTRVFSLRTNAGEFIGDELERLGMPLFKRGITFRPKWQEFFINGKPPCDAQPEGAGAEIAAVADEAERVVTELLNTKRGAA